MTIHNNVTSTASISPSSENHQTPPSINNRVEEVAFDVLFSQQSPSDTEQLRFELNEYKKVGSQHYTIVTWKGKRYRITVHDNKRKLAYSEQDWQRVEHRTLKVLDKVQNDKHFFKGTLQLHAKTKNKWKVTYKSNTPQVERSVNKKVIREFKNLLEKQINPINILPAVKPPKKLERASYPSNMLDKPVKKEGGFLEFPKKILEKIKDYLRPLKSNTNDTDIKEVKKERSPFAGARDYFFPPNRIIDDFDDLASSEAASISSFKEINPIDGDNTSIGGITNVSTKEINPIDGDNTNIDVSSRVSEDDGPSYSLRIKK